MIQTKKIASRENQRLKLARKARDGKAGDKIFIEGLRLAEEALRSQISINECFVSHEFGELKRERELLFKLSVGELQIFEVSDSIFTTIADTKNSQGIILIGDRPPNGRSLIEKTLGKQYESHSIVIVLDKINDPANVGAIFRTAEAAGVAGVVVSNGSADVFSPKALRAAMGAGFRVPVWENCEVDEVLAWAKDNKLVLTAADVKADILYTKINWQIPRLLVFGSEAHGLDSKLLEKMDEVIQIPMMNGVESLNLSVSCGILLFEALRQNSSL
ncbi:MAG: RNA methyltransferase [Acidobacteriota bacterium]|nr:RNA methyltransferase [Acidobacteriota bacterium]